MSQIRNSKRSSFIPRKLIRVNISLKFFNGLKLKEVNPETSKNVVTASSTINGHNSAWNFRFQSRWENRGLFIWLIIENFFLRSEESFFWRYFEVYKTNEWLRRYPTEGDSMRDRMRKFSAIQNLNHHQVGEKLEFLENRLAVTAKVASKGQ